MADKRTQVSVVQLKGPAGNSAIDKRTQVSQVNLHGPTDKRTFFSAISLQAPPADKRTRFSQVQLVGPSAPPRSVYIGTTSGWVPVDIYLPVAGVWKKII